MRHIKLKDYLNYEDVLDEIFEFVKDGKVVLMAADTSYGFTGDASNKEVRERICEFKNMPKDKMISLCMGSKAMLVDFLELDLVTAELVEEYLPGFLTIVGRGNDKNEIEYEKGCLEYEAMHDGGFVGVRLPEHNLMVDLAKKLGRPIFTTSANVHGKPSCYSLHELQQQMGDAFLDIDLVVDAGVLEYEAPSSVVKVDDNVISILRAGRVSDELVGRYKLS
jgi:tRNA threonylcarbamoyl adenosine modification protein (Sua5/YciO/YrdC/YwlC family)